MSKSAAFWRAVGGRKMGNGYLYAALVTWMAGRVEPFPFDAYAMWLAAALLGTSMAVAIEDRKGAKPFPNRREGDTG